MTYTVQDEHQNSRDERPALPMSTARRDSRFELLRILAMLMIVAHHFAVHSHIPYPALRPVDDLTFFNIVFTQTIGGYGAAGVFLYGAISGYFMLNKIPALTRVLKLLVITWLYSVLFYLWAVLSARVQPEVYGLLRALMPLTFQTWWFISAYVLLCLLAPCLNLCLNQLTHAVLATLLILVGVLWFVLPSLMMFHPLHGDRFFGNWFLYLTYAYACGAFIRRFYPQGIAARYPAGVLLLCVTALIFWFCACETQALNRPTLTIFWYWATEHDSVLQTLPALALLLLSLRVKPFSSRLINCIGSLMLGVYLIHNNPYLREYLWLELFAPGKHLADSRCWVYVLGVPCAVFMACAAAEGLRKLVLDPLIGCALERIAVLKRLDERIKSEFTPPQQDDL